MIPLAPVSWIRRVWHTFLANLDAESIRNFQRMYYVFIFVGGIYLAVGADLPPTPIEDSLGESIYWGWIGLNIVCPVMAFLGQYLTWRAAFSAPEEGNPGLGGAWLQFGGDGGIWAAICIYVMCVFNTTWWGQGLYAVFFVAMGIPGGGMFTWRSFRRLRQISRRAGSTQPIHHLQRLRRACLRSHRDRS